MKINLRPYQQSAIRRVIDAIVTGCKQMIIRAPTGAGKTIIAARIIYGAEAKKTRVLFLAHRTELITQCSQKLDDLGVFHGIVKPGFNPQMTARVHVASVATLVNRQFPAPDIIIIDEAHHARAASYEKIVARYPNAILLGLTATPARTDGKGLGKLFKRIINVTNYTDLISEGYLVPFRIFEPTKIDFTGVKTVAGDFNKKQAAERMAKSKIHGDILEQWKDKASDRSTILFAASVADSRKYLEEFRAVGVVAEHVDGTTPDDERKAIFDGFRAGRIQLLCNVGVATEGTDLPIASCIILANPTRSLVLHHQMVGRGLRPNDGKEDCIILDHVGNHSRLGWIDDEIEWTLDCNKSAKNLTREGPKAQPIRTCPKCYMSLRGGSPKCERCGHEFIKQGRELQTVAGELKEAVRTPKSYGTTKDPLTFFVEKLLHGEKNGYRPGWAAVQFKVVFGKFPDFPKADVKIRRMELEEL